MKETISRRSRINLSELGCRNVFERNSPCVCADHILATFDLDVSTTYQTFCVLPSSDAHLEKVLFLSSADYGIRRSDFDINFMTLSSADSRMMTLSFIKKFMIPITSSSSHNDKLLVLLLCNDMSSRSLCRCFFVVVAANGIRDAKEKRKKKQILTVMGQRSESAKKA